MEPRWFVVPTLAATLVLVAVAAAANGNANFRAVCPAAAVGEAHCHALVATDANGNPTASSAPPAGSYGPSQFHAGYSLPTTAPSAQSIGIVDAYDDPNIENDLAVYDTQTNVRKIGLVLREPRRLLRAAGDVAGAVGASARASELAGVHD